jgi:hypothetical protein
MPAAPRWPSSPIYVGILIFPKADLAAAGVFQPRRNIPAARDRRSTRRQLRWHNARETLFSAVAGEEEHENDRATASLNHSSNQ